MECRQSEDISSFLYLIKSIAENEKPDSYDKTQTRAFINKNGIRVVLQKNWEDKGNTWLVSGYGLLDDEGKIKKEATETIKTVNAQYGYKPEHSRLREQVGAVIASISNIREQQQKSQGFSITMLHFWSVVNQQTMSICSLCSLVLFRLLLQ